MAMQPHDFLSITCPCCPCCSFHSGKENVKLFKTIKIILKRVIPKIQHQRARIELNIYIYWGKQQVVPQIRRNCMHLHVRTKLCYSWCTGHHLSRLMMFESRGWPMESVLTNPHLFFLFNFFSFPFLSLIPSKMRGKPDIGWLAS